MARWRDSQASDHQPSSTSPVNKFGIHPAIGPFHGAGRCRTLDRSIAARERRHDAATIAEMLFRGGLSADEVYRTPAEIKDSILAVDGSGLHDDLGRPRRAWAGFPDHAFTLKTKAGREYGLFAQTHGIDHVIQVVVRPPDSIIDLTDFAIRHSLDSKRLGGMLRHARKSRAPGFNWDIVSAEIKNVGNGGWTIDSHFHLTVRGVDADTLARIEKYFTACEWSFWFSSDDDDEERHPAALAQYQAKGLANAIGDGTDWFPEAMAELRRQTRNITMTRSTGAFRLWKSEIAKTALAVVEDRDGKPMMAQRRIVSERPRRLLQQSCSFIALRLCVHDFGDGLFRRAIRVRGGKRVSLAEVAAVYDLSYLNEVNTAIPKFTVPTPSTILPSSASAPPRADPPSANDWDKIPW